MDLLKVRVLQGFVAIFELETVSNAVEGIKVFWVFFQDFFKDLLRLFILAYVEKQVVSLVEPVLDLILVRLQFVFAAH